MHLHIYMHIYIYMRLHKQKMERITATDTRGFPFGVGLLERKIRRQMFSNVIGSLKIKTFQVADLEIHNVYFHNRDGRGKWWRETEREMFRKMEVESK